MALDTKLKQLVLFVISGLLNGGFRLDVANTRNSNQGFRRGEIAQTARVGGRIHMRTGRSVERGLGS